MEGCQQPNGHKSKREGCGTVTSAIQKISLLGIQARRFLALPNTDLRPDLPLPKPGKIERVGAKL
jgi:hypothetical protein